MASALDALLTEAARLIATQRYADAVPIAQSAVNADPNCSEAHMKLGIALSLSAQAPLAIESFQRAIALQPDFAACYHELGYSYTAVARLPEAIAAYRRAFELKPRLPNIGSNVLMNLNYIDDIEPQDVFREHLRVAQSYPSPNPPPRRDAANRRIRIGYYSPDFCAHPLYLFTSPLLQLADRNRFELFCYSDVVRPDAITQILQRTGHAWRDVARANDSQLDAAIRQDQLDILVDLAGHTARNRIAVIASKPAPILINYLGYLNTTGLPSVDYRLTDHHADPSPLRDSLHSERLVRLPESFVTYVVPRGLPEPSPPPCLSRGYVTFGSFNNLLKISPTIASAWAKVLDAVPNSRLRLSSSFFPDPAARDVLFARLSAAGIDVARVTFLPPQDGLLNHLLRYFDFDIALDTFPYQGGTTTCEAMQMGVPVVALSAPSHVSRIGVSLLINSGQSHMLASNVPEFVRIAADLATDPVRLSHLRRTLRGQMTASRLCDQRGFVRNVEAAYQSMILTPPSA